jgi:hypothetical protein
MPIDMRKIIVYILPLGFFFTSCDPELNCPQPRCQHSDVYPDSPIIATLSGNMDSVINIGDTFKVSIKIPETLKTNYGNLEVKNIQAGSFFYFNYTGVNSFFDLENSTTEYLNLKIIKGLGPGSQDNFQKMGWDLLEREYQAYFIPAKKGKYIFQIKNSRTEVKSKDEKEWLVNLDIQFQQGRPYRVEQYRNFFAVDSHKRDVNYNKMLDVKNYWYWFEVK